MKIGLEWYWPFKKWNSLVPKIDSDGISSMNAKGKTQNFLKGLQNAVWTPDDVVQDFFELDVCSTRHCDRIRLMVLASFSLVFLRN